MKTIAFTAYGSPDDLRLIDVDKPVPAEGDVLVQVGATSINSWDWELLKGTPFANRILFGLFRPVRLKTLGFDIAGRVVATGGGVHRFQVGDEVYGDLSACGWGGFAEYVAAPETALVRKPAHLSFTQAAAVPQAALLAWQAMVDVGHIQAGDKILINGASGGSGTFAIQIARTFGAEITGVCSTDKMDFVGSLGADHVIDYTHEDFTRNGQKYDLIIDAHARHSVFACRRALAPKGIYVVHGGATFNIMQMVVLAPLFWFSRKKMHLLMHKPNKGLDELDPLLDSGRVVPIVDQVFPLSDTIEALKYYGAHKARGKVVVQIADV